MNIQAFFKITYGLYIIASKNGSRLNGYIANTAFQVTAEPPQIAISCSKDNHTCHMIEASGVFSISILSQNAKPDIIGLFGYNSGKEINKFNTIAYTFGTTGAPIVTEDCLAWFDCRVNQSMDLGSHMLFIATIEDNALLEESGIPLTYAYYHEVKKGKAPKNAPTYIDEKRLQSNTIVAEPRFKKYKCLACGYVYDPAIGDPEANIPPGTPFEELPDEWVCPTCGSGKALFEPIT